MKDHLGIEIGQEYLKILIGKASSKQVKLLSCSVEAIVGLDDRVIAERINAIIKENRFKPKFLTISLPRNFVTVRNLHLPSKDSQEIGKMIEMHISRIVPYKKDEVVFTYHISGIDDLGHTRITLAIVHNDIIRKQVKILDRVGILIDRIILSSYGIWRWIYDNCSSEINTSDTYLILDVDSTFTDFIIFKEKGILFSRSIAIRAEELNNDHGKTRFLGEIRQSLLLSYNEENTKRPSKIFLSGGVESSLAQLMEKELEIKVKHIEAASSLGKAKIKNRGLPAGISITPLSQITLQQDEAALVFVLPDIEIRKSLKSNTKNLVILGSLITCIFGILSFTFLGKSYNKKSYLRLLEKESAKVEQEIGDLAKQLDKINFVSNYLNLRGLPLYVVYHIQQITRDNMAFTLISIEDDSSIILRGQTEKLSDVFDLLSDLGEIKYFKDAKTRYTRKRKLRDREIIDFEINFIIEI